MLIKNIKADLHTHGWCGQESGFGQFILKILGERGERNLQTIAERGFKEEQNTLIGFVNFDDTRYQKIVNTRGELLKGYELNDDNVQRFVGVYDQNKKLWNFVLRGQEIPTDKGHLLVLGNDKEIARRTIEDALKEAGDMDALVVGDHILGLGGIGKENLIQYREKIDAIEYCNSNFPGQTKQLEKIGKEFCIPGLYSSDSHNIEQMFSSYMVFPEIDFSSWENLRERILKGAEDKDTIGYPGKNRILELPIHIIAVAYNIVRQKIGWVKMPEYKIE